MIQKEFIAHLEKELCIHFSETVSVMSHHTAHGGDINEAYLIETSQGKFFLKINDEKIGDDLFEKEKRGLLLLSKADCIRIPLPLFNGKHEGKIFLVMEFISRGVPTKGFWNEFGKSLACLHHQGSKEFGLDHNNYIGSIPQSNRQHDDWTGFYASERILKLTNALLKMGLLETPMANAAENLCADA